MKKLLTVLLTVVIVFSFATTVFAASGLNNEEKAIIAELQNGVKVNGKTVAVPAEYLNQAKNYMLSDGVEITADQKTIIVNDIANAEKIIADAGITDLTKLSASAKSQVMALAQNSAATVGLKLTYNSSNKSATITDSNNKVVFTAENIIKATGAGFDATTLVVICGALVALIAAGAVVGKKCLNK